MTNKTANQNRSVGRPKAFDEQEALTAAMHYFWEHGYDNTSLDNLLLAMGIKKSSFYATFKSKEEVFSRTLVLYREQNIQYLRGLKSEIGAKKAMFTLTELTLKELQETGKVRGCLLINSGKECYNKYDDLSHQIKEDFNYILDLFIEFTQAAQDNGEIKSTKDAKIIAGRYMNALNGLVVTIQAGASPELVDDLVESLKEILE
jgi:TetR/AcrR family transcriptional repressor of nem operon